jgi:hypothetical protein
VITHWCIVQPNPSATKCFLDRHVTAGDGISDWKSDLIKRYIVDAKPPNEVLDITHVFLMWLRGKYCLDQPTAIMNLPDVAYLLEGSDALLHYRNFLWAVEYLLDRYGFGGASVNDALVILHRHEGPVLVEDTPIFFYNGK